MRASSTLVPIFVVENQGLVRPDGVSASETFSSLPSPHTTGSRLPISAAISRPLADSGR